MDVISKLIARVEDYRATNKNPCKNYGTQAAAQAAAGKAAQQAANHFAKDLTKDADPCRYVVFYVPAWGRWVGRTGLYRTARSRYVHWRLLGMHARMVLVLSACIATDGSHCILRHLLVPLF